MASSSQQQFVPKDDVARRWWTTWQNYVSVLTRHDVMSYFKDSIGLTMMHGHLVMPNIIFGPLDQIETTELESALALLDATILALPIETRETGVMTLHGCLPQVLAQINPRTTLQLTCAFAEMYCNFEQSPMAALLCFERYRICKSFLSSHAGQISFCTALKKFPKTMPRQLVAQTAKLTPFTIQNASWDNNCSEMAKMRLAVLLNVIIEAKQRGLTADVPISWMPWYNSIIIIKSTTAKQEPFDTFLLPIIHHTMGQNMPHYKLWQQYYPPNYTIHIGETALKVYDWSLASVFPFFAKALASGLEEATSKIMTLPTTFPVALLERILEYGCGVASAPTSVDERQIVMSETPPANMLHNQQPLEAFGIYYLSLYLKTGNFVAPRKPWQATEEQNDAKKETDLCHKSDDRHVAYATPSYGTTSNPFAPPSLKHSIPSPCRDLSSPNEQHRTGKF